jgi:hypothetical protein
MMSAARPFMLYCVGILIFGVEFYVGIFGCDGIMNNHNIYKGENQLHTLTRTSPEERTPN